ncbi:hypothetical protein QQF64_025324 [Cirrhinus molitorella]|uniref:Fibronectin type-III domain-containing protein n=1 Tax=Cirrhinus molitorella TaxID=172907 RepID=A0ABR3NNP5_9TELE
MRKNLSHFRSFSKANKDDNSIRFIISAISDPSNKGSSIYLYEQGKLTNTHFQPMSKPPPPIVKDVQDQTVSLKLQKSPTGETVQYRVEYKQVKTDSGAEEQWLVINTADEDFTLTGLESGKPYLIRYRIVSKVGVSEASDTVSPIPTSAQPMIVGGTEGSAVTFMTPSITTIQKIKMYYVPTPIMSPGLFKAIQVVFKSGNMIKVGNTAQSDEKEFLFDHNDKIIAATLWPNKDGLGGMEFEVAKSDGTKITLSIMCPNLGEPVKVDVKSGKCFGITARTGDRLNALGFYFI